MRILIELPTWLGDAVMTTPAIENLIDFYNDVSLTFIGSSVSTTVLKNHPNAVEVIILDKKYLQIFKTARDLEKFDLFLSFRASFRSKIFKFLVPSKKKYQFNGNKFNKGHQVQKYNNFINDSIGREYNPKDLKLHQKQNKNTHLKKLLGINPGGSYGSSKRWYPEEFAKVAISLSSEYDIIIFGGKGEIDIASHIEKLLILEKITNYHNLVGKTSIETLVNKISLLDLFITNDSGPMHIAAAFKIPTISIFGPTRFQETSQWMNKKSKIISKDLDCQPCMKRECPLEHHNCMKMIKANEILEAVTTL